MPELPFTMYDKIWASHLVSKVAGGHDLLYIDRHLVQEVSSPQAFDGLKGRGLKLRRRGAHIAVADHAVSTDPDTPPRSDSLAARQLARLEENARAFGLPYIPLDDLRHGIVHIIGPELGFTLPGATLVCGDSHTSTHGAFGALAFGIGTSECEIAMAVQCLRQKKQKQMRVTLTGELSAGVSVKDVVLALIAKFGTGWARGYAIEYAGSFVKGLSMEGRMTLCNMSIEAGSRSGLVAPDETTFAYLRGRPLAPGPVLWNSAVAAWRELATDADAQFDREVDFDVSALAPQVSWGTTPAETIDIDSEIPDPGGNEGAASSLDYMGIIPGQSMRKLAIDQVFIGSCTNGRIEDLRRTAAVVSGRKVAPGVRALVVPGSAAVRAQAESEGLDRIFVAAGFEWRKAGCSMCVAMNDDRLKSGERCASTSNRNFEGRQGAGGRTHLMSPEMAAAAAVTGQITDVRKLLAENDDG